MLESESPHARGWTPQTHFDRHKERRAKMYRPAELKRADIMDPEEAPRSPVKAEVVTLAPGDITGFNRFATDPGNQLAVSACRGFAGLSDSGPCTFRLAYLHGEADTGKTHLLRATVDALGGGRAKYLTADQFASGDSTLYKELRKTELIAVDDIYAIQRADALGRLTALVSEAVTLGRGVLLAGRGPVTYLPESHASLVARLQASGAQIGMSLPSREARVQAVRKYLERYDDDTLGEDLVEELVSLTKGGAGQAIQGAKVLLTYQSASGMPMTSGTMREILGQQEGECARRPAVAEIRAKCAKYFGVSETDMISARRTRVVVTPRQVAMYLSRKGTLMSLPDIGRRFGNRDHTTVLHACRKIPNLCARDPELRRQVTEIAEEMGIAVPEINDPSNIKLEFAAEIG